MTNAIRGGAALAHGVQALKIIRDQEQYNQVTISIDKDSINDLFKTLNGMNVKFISEVLYTLEKHFNEIMTRKEIV